MGKRTVDTHRWVGEIAEKYKERQERNPYLQLKKRWENSGKKMPAAKILYKQLLNEGRSLRTILELEVGRLEEINERLDGSYERKPPKLGNSAMIIFYSFLRQRNTVNNIKSLGC